MQIKRVRTRAPVDIQIKRNVQRHGNIRCDRPINQQSKIIRSTLQIQGRLRAQNEIIGKADLDAF